MLKFTKEVLPFGCLSNMIEMKFGNAAPIITAWIIDVAYPILYRRRFISIVILNMPIEFPVKLQSPQVIGIEK